MNCQEFEDLYWLKVYGEAIPGGEDGLMQHLSECEACRDRQVEIDRMYALLTIREPLVPQEAALQRARNLLAARIQAEQGQPRARRIRDRVSDTLRGWFAPRWQPALTLATLLVGVLLGRVLFSGGLPEGGMPLPPGYEDLATLEKKYIEDKILNAESRISDLRIKPIDTEAGLVQISFRGTRDYEVVGTQEDEVVRNLLTWAIKNEQNSGARLNSVQQLAKASLLSTGAREALAYALIHDENDGVRLRALEALAASPIDQLTEQAILGSLLKDPNPAIRIRAIDMLLANKQTDKTTSLMLSLAEADSNDYVRMRARQAIKETENNYDMLNTGP